MREDDQMKELYVCPNHGKSRKHSNTKKFSEESDFIENSCLNITEAKLFEKIIFWTRWKFLCNSIYFLHLFYSPFWIFL